MVAPRLVIAAVLLQVALALAHGDDSHGGMDMGDMKEPDASDAESKQYNDDWNKPSYWGSGSNNGLMVAHVVFMVLAWFFTLPIGVVFSVVRSRFLLPVQLLFLVLNGLGVMFGTIYNVNTPDLYPSNAHHRIGWIATWIVCAHVVMSLLFAIAGRGKQAAVPATSGEQAAFLPISAANMAQNNMRPYSDYRWSGDSGQGTECSSDNSRDISPNSPYRRDTLDQFEKPEPEPEDDDDEDEEPQPAAIRSPWLRKSVIDKYLPSWLQNLFSTRLLRIFEIAYNVVDRLILVLGFIALLTGIVTYAGIFKGINVFSGLAHFIKGGIFFWYGLLTLGRWMGCFADLGWAWNVKPTRSEVGQWKAALPSAEFTESFVIWLYGASNVFLEHLASWGGAWSAQDLEHVSISIMFFGGGLLGMLVESTTVRSWLNTVVETMPASSEIHPSEAHQQRSQPKTYTTSLNPLPALIIMLLGVMMSSHHQDSMISTMVHKQWGTLLVGFSVARLFTYVLMYISPPTTVFPSRPPTELVSAFCLMSGGLIFMASARDVIRSMESADLMAMFVFTVVMGFTAFVMAYEVLVLALKGWALRKELKAGRAA